MYKFSFGECKKGTREMPVAIGAEQLENGLWKAYSVCSGADRKYFIADTKEKAWEMAKNYLDENYFNLTNEEINKRVLLRKAQEK